MNWTVMKFSLLPLTGKIKTAKYSHNSVNKETAKIFNRENFPSYGTVRSVGFACTSSIACLKLQLIVDLCEQ